MNNKTEIVFEKFPKIARLSRRMVITEKLDGTNAQVIITEDGQIAAASRSRLITPEDDNFGFARWVQDHKAELLGLGPGRHFGEWWGSGINKRYGGSGNPWPKTFSLFNVAHWNIYSKLSVNAVPPPPCCSVVPILYVGEFNTVDIDFALAQLDINGSVAAPGCKSEGVVVYHETARLYFKKTIEGDSEPKGKKV